MLFKAILWEGRKSKEWNKLNLLSLDWCHLVRRKGNPLTASFICCGSQVDAKKFLWEALSVYYAFKLRVKLTLYTKARRPFLRGKNQGGKWSSILQVSPFKFLLSSASFFLNSWKNKAFGGFHQTVWLKPFTILEPCAQTTKLNLLYFF